jgi:hypothetical protein
VIMSHKYATLVGIVMALAVAGCGSNATLGGASAPTTALVGNGATSSSSLTDEQQSLSQSCVATFTQHTLAERAWAFDGTATRETTGHDSHLGAVPTTTFHVNHWYKGGAAATVKIEFSFKRSEDQNLRGGIGTRVLVTGEPRWGGRALDDPIAWGCGFTQVWTAPAAQEWSTTFGR